MYTIFQTQHFLRKAHKLLRKNPQLDAKLSQSIHSMEHDPFNASLKTHAVIAHLDGRSAMSSFVTKDLRIIWRLSNGHIRFINLLDLGGHSGGGKVYR
jgi:mRNA-degrading endonuclease YafQ of YafQ-DinJ toxin-antitoxin module